MSNGTQRASGKPSNAEGLSSMTEAAAAQRVQKVAQMLAAGQLQAPEQNPSDRKKQMARLPQDLLDALDKSMAEGFQAQDAYQMELQKQSTTDGSQASPQPTQDNES